MAETTIAAEQAPVGEEAVQQDTPVTTEEPANKEEAPVESVSDNAFNPAVDPPSCSPDLNWHVLLFLQASPEALAIPSTKTEV